MNILVTGGCGFIGINLISYLLGKIRDCKIRVVDDLSVGKREDLLTLIEITEVSGEKIIGAPGSSLELVVGDIKDSILAFNAC